MKRFTVAVLVNNQSGVLNRVTSMFRRRQFNINSLTVSETESPDYSRITVISEGEEATKNQLIEQLYKLSDVYSIKELSNDDTISCELLLIKMENNPKNREGVRAAADAFNAQIVDYTRDSMMFQLTAESKRIDDFISLMKDYKIIEICRTGVVCLEKGATSIRKVSYL